MKRNNLFSEEIYVLKRRIKAFFYSTIFFICRIFPIEKNKIIFWTFEGTRGFCCNPKYMAEELLRRNRENGAKWELIWLVDEANAEFPSGIEKVKNTLWNRVYQMSTAKYWIGNTRTFYGTKKRKGQMYIQTWHGSICIKPIGKYRGELFPRIAYLVSRADSKLIDYVLSNCKWCDIHYRDGLVYDGTIIRSGKPRCDILINKREEMKGQIRKVYGIPESGKILLYAPTFRGGSQLTKRTVEKSEGSIDFEKLCNSLEYRFGGEWFIFVRLHPQLAAQNEHYFVRNTEEKFIDVTQHLDMNELIAAVDAFISDYSGAIFEAALLKMPCFIYADDLEDYIENRGKLFFDLYELPFPVALRSEDLIKNIVNFDSEAYVEKVDSFIIKQGIVEDGHSSERAVNLIDRGGQWEKLEYCNFHSQILKEE